MRCRWGWDSIASTEFAKFRFARRNCCNMFGLVKGLRGSDRNPQRANVWKNPQIYFCVLGNQKPNQCSEAARSNFSSDWAKKNSEVLVCGKHLHQSASSDSQLNNRELRLHNISSILSVHVSRNIGAWQRRHVTSFREANKSPQNVQFFNAKLPTKNSSWSAAAAMALWHNFCTFLFLFLAEKAKKTSSSQSRSLNSKCSRTSAPISMALQLMKFLAKCSATLTTLGFNERAWITRVFGCVGGNCQFF